MDERRATERRSDGGKSDGEKSNGATDGQSDGATERPSNGENKRRSDRKSERISDGGTERRSDSNKTKISRLLNSYRKIDHSRDLEQGFSNAPTVGVLDNYQYEGEACGVPGDDFDDVERR